MLKKYIKRMTHFVKSGDFGPFFKLRLESVAKIAWSFYFTQTYSF